MCSRPTTENVKPQSRANIQNKHRAQHRATANWKRYGAQKHNDMKAPNTQADTIMYVVNNSDRTTCIGMSAGKSRQVRDANQQRLDIAQQREPVIPHRQILVHYQDSLEEIVDRRP